MAVPASADTILPISPSYYPLKVIIIITNYNIIHLT